MHCFNRAYCATDPGSSALAVLPRALRFERRAFRAVGLRPCQLREDAAGDLLDDIIRRLNQFFESEVEFFGPYMFTTLCSNELDGDAGPLIHFPHAALENIPGPERLADLADIH